MNQRELKAIHEESISKIFVSLYNAKLKFIRHGDDKTEPDCIFKYKKLLLGIEVVSAYYDNEHAKDDWTFAKSLANGKDLVGFGREVIVNPSELFLGRIQKEIDKKCEIVYSGVGNTVLCIEERNPLSEKKDVEYFIYKIKIPAVHNFSEIFILHLAASHEGGKYSIFKLF